MTIGPQELLEKVVREEQPHIKQAEQVIDRTLESTYDGTNYVTIDAKVFEGIRRPSINQLLANYRQRGWTVERHSDQREGDCYQFSTRVHYDQRETRGGFYGR